MPKYTEFDDTATTIKKIDDNGTISFVPADPRNPDYREFLEWKRKGNKPTLELVSKTPTIDPVIVALVKEVARLSGEPEETVRNRILGDG